MYNKTSMTIVTELTPEFVMYCISSGTKIISMEMMSIPDENTSYFNIPIVSALAPIGDLADALLDNVAYNGYNPVEVYYNYLTTDNICQGILSSMLTSLLKNNIVIYMTNDDMMLFGTLFIDYLVQMYGIQCAIDWNGFKAGFSFNPAFRPRILELMYFNNHITAYDFLKVYPKNTLFDRGITIVRKLVLDVQPFTIPLSDEQYYEYFLDVIRNDGNLNRRMVTLL